MGMSGPTHAYMAIKPCGHVNTFTVDIAEYRRDTAKKVACWIRDGWQVERVPIEKARQMLYCCDCETTSA